MKMEKYIILQYLGNKIIAYPVCSNNQYLVYIIFEIQINHTYAVPIFHKMCTIMNIHLAFLVNLIIPHYFLGSINHITQTIDAFRSRQGI